MPADLTRCENCQHHSFEGECMTLPVCEAGVILEDEGLDHGKVEAEIDAWAKAGMNGPCPHYRACWYMDADEVEAFIQYTARNGGRHG